MLGRHNRGVTHVTKHFFRKFLIAVLVLGALAVVGTMDMQDEADARRLYCEQVQAGHWPDYRGDAATCPRPGQ